MRGRLAASRSPFDTFAACIRQVPAGADITDGETFTLNDGKNELTWEWDDNASVLPGHIAIPFVGTETKDQVAALIIAHCLGPAWTYGWLDIEWWPLDYQQQGNPWFQLVSHRSHPGMYGWGLRFATTMAHMTVAGWGQWYMTGNGYYPGALNAWGRSWFSIRWGLSRGVGAIAEPRHPTPPDHQPPIEPQGPPE
jgi:hypothetical protein